MKKSLSKNQFLSVSIMLFGLFFGAGNLIFPPMLGHQAGNLTFISLLFFAITAVVFPILAVIAVAKTSGLTNLANRVGPVFSLVFTSLIYLSIGPGLGIPRAGSLPFEMAVQQYLPEGVNIFSLRLLYTLFFFLSAFLISLNPSKLVNRVGKVLTPTLLVLILFMFIGVIISGINIPTKPADDYISNAPVKGFLEGYNTMDAIAGLNFGLVIALAIKSFNVKDDKNVMRYTVKAGFLAGTVLFIIYAMLSYIGMVTGQITSGVENGAQVLVITVNKVFGNFGGILLVSIFTLACLTTCVGLITSGSGYFAKLTNNKISYKKWTLLFSAFSFVVANFGLNKILAVSVPVLVSIYPISLTLIILTLFHDKLGFSKLAYKATIYVVSLISVVEGLLVAKIEIPILTNFVKQLPLFKQSLGWLIPGLIVLVLAIFVSVALKLEKFK